MQALPGLARGEVKRRAPSKLVKSGDRIVEPANQARLFGNPKSIVSWKFPYIFETGNTGVGTLQFVSFQVSPTHLQS